MADNIQTIPGIIKFWAENEPEAETFKFVNKHGRYALYTPRDVYTLAGKFAARLRQYGFVEGDVIANGLPTSPERLVTDMGILLAGCVMVNCQVLEQDGTDFYNTANGAQCKGVIISTKSDDPAFRIMSTHLPQPGQRSGCVDVSVPQVDTLTKVVLCTRDSKDKNNSLIGSLQASTDPPLITEVQPDDLAVLFTTSGSSGFCKLVPRSHEEVLRCGRAFQGSKGSTYFNDRVFGWMGGFPFDFLAHCSRRVLQDMLGNEYAITPSELWEVISREKCPGATLTPYQMLDLVHEFKDAVPEFKLSFLVTGGQALRENMTSALGVLTNAIVVCYSSTEASMVTVGVVTSASQFREFYSGQPVTGINPEVKVVDKEGNVLEPEVEGEILVKSPLVMKGYYKQPVTGDVFTHDGWFRSGDRGCLDATGNLYCYGRSGDIISRGSIIIYATWPESILSKCKELADVKIIGVPDEFGGEKLCACVIRKSGSDLTEDRLLKFYESSLMTSKAKSKDKFRPEISNVLFMDSFPQTQSGKINRKLLKVKVKYLLEGVDNTPCDK